MPLKICVIGCGWMAETGHGPGCRRYAAEYPDTELTACCDIDSNRAGAFQRKFGFLRNYTDYREMLIAEKPDAVCLLVNEAYICPISMEIFALGIPLLLEKPPGLNMAETSRMAEAAARYNVPHAVAFNRRSAPVVNMLRRELAGLSDIQRFYYEMLRIDRRDRDFTATAIHGIDALRYIANADYRHIDFTYQELPGLGEGVCNIALEARLTNGATAGLLFAPVGGIVCERGQVISHTRHIEFAMPIPTAADGLVRRYENGSLARETRENGELYIAQGFYEENRAFFEDVRAGRSPAHTLETALQSVAVADCIRTRKAVYNG
ncbi:MAG: Gfo/Idh/MocA family oxidoreductase [Oscillospiraceae bacterium]|nr:Gfo/Idh/MocA family oxidoreductase [Oscillospiraceae bacterium]